MAREIRYKTVFASKKWQCHWDDHAKIHEKLNKVVGRLQYMIFIGCNIWVETERGHKHCSRLLDQVQKIQLDSTLKESQECYEMGWPYVILIRWHRMINLYIYIIFFKHNFLKKHRQVLGSLNSLYHAGSQHRGLYKLNSYANILISLINWYCPIHRSFLFDF